MSTELTYEQMPLWMRRSQQHFDWGIVFAVLIGLLAAWPFLNQPQLSMENGQLHDAFRTADTAAMLREGRLYPRWSPHAFSGYGAPIPNYIAPGAPYLAAVIEVLFTDDTLTALRIAYSLSLTAAALGIYLLVTRWSGCVQGLLATALYALSPYVGLTLPHLSGNLALMCSAALLPLTLWTFDRLLHDESPFELLYVGLLITLQMLIAPQILLITLLFCIFQVIRTRLTAPVALRILMAWLCGLGLASMFWLPALAESALVEWRGQPLVSLLPPVTLHHLFQPMNGIDSLQLSPNPQLTVGLPLWISVFIVTAFGLIRRIRLSDPFPMILVLLTGLVGWLIVIDPQAHWLLIPITLCAAMIASAVIHVTDLLPATFRRIIPPLIIGGLLMLAYPIWLAPAPDMPITSVTPAAQVRYEHLTGRSALIPSTNAIPTTLPQNIDTNPLLVNSYAFTSSRSFDTLSRIVPPQLIRNGQLNILWQHTHASLFRIPDDQSRITQPRTPTSPPGSTTAFAFTWLTAYFPGWEARLDGAPLQIVPEAATNLIRVELPVGSGGALLLQLNETPIRRISWGLAGIALVMLLLLTRQTVRHDQPEQRISPIRYMRAYELRLFGVLTVCFMVVFGFLSLTPSGSALRAPGGSDLQTAAPIRLQTSVGLQLFGYQTGDQTEFASSARPGQQLDLTLYWRVLRTLPENFWVRLSLIPASGENDAAPHILSQRMPGDLPTRLWPAERYVRDVYALRLPDQIPAGLYLIGMEIFACDGSICDTESPVRQVALFTEESRTALQRFDLPMLIDVQP